MWTVKRVVALVALAAASISCGDVVRQGRAPVFLIIDTLTASRLGTGTGSSVLLSDVITFVGSVPTVFNDTGTVTLRLAPKNVTIENTPTAPTSNSDVTITRYHVAYRRADGRNTPGVDVPYAFDGAATGTVSVGGTLGLGFELVRHIAKQESPLVQLTNSPSVITTIAEVTFYGRDQVGNEISVTGLIQVDFANFGD